MASDMALIWVGPKRKSFCKQDWTGGITLILQENFFSSGTRAYAEPCPDSDQILQRSAMCQQRSLRFLQSERSKRPRQQPGCSN
jgi:hypothetical protein